MSIVTLSSPRIYVDGGALVTYQGTPHVCTYWEVVGVIAGVEGAPTGTLLEKILMTDANGFAVNQYIGSADEADAEKIERIKVSEADA